MFLVATGNPERGYRDWLLSLVNDQQTGRMMDPLDRFRLRSQSLNVGARARESAYVRVCLSAHLEPDFVWLSAPFRLCLSSFRCKLESR